MQALPKLAPPPELTMQLRVLGSKEASRRRRLASAEAFFSHARELAKLWSSLLMRPYAVPATGGVLSTVLFFSLLSPSLTINRNILQDVPTALSTPAELEGAIASMSLGQTADIVVDVTIDDQGRVVGYSAPKGEAWAKNPEMVRRVENTLLFTVFKPATLLGEKVTGRSRITLRRSVMDVEG
ncbi:MAG: hypothetical protein U0Q16_34185 [Bryobacteraceae bacterium]